MTELSEFSPTRLSEIPCMRSSLLQGIAGGVGFAAVRLLTGRPAGESLLPFSFQPYLVFRPFAIWPSLSFFQNPLPPSFPLLDLRGEEPV